MSKRRLGVKKKSHLTRNLIIAIILIATTAIGVAATGALNGFLNPQPTSFPVIIHVYDSTLLPGGPDTFSSPNQLVANVTISLEGPLNITQLTPSGVLSGGPLNTTPNGNYHVTATCTDPCQGYGTANTSYVVGPECNRKDSIGNCHIWIAMNRV